MYNRAIWCITLALPFPLTGVADAGDDESSASKGPVIENLELLDLYVTNWNVIAHYFNEKGEEVATVKGTEEIIWTLGHRALQRTYTTSAESVVYRAVGMLTWNDLENVYHGAWFDNVSTSGPTVVKAEWNASEKEMVYNLQSVAGDGSPARYRVVERFTDDRHRVVTTYVLEGQRERRILEVEYRRAVPCPAGRQRIIDELNP